MLNEQNASQEIGTITDNLFTGYDGVLKIILYFLIGFRTDAGVIFQMYANDKQRQEDKIQLIRENGETLIGGFLEVEKAVVCAMSDKTADMLAEKFSQDEGFRTLISQNFVVPAMIKFPEQKDGK